MNIPQQNYWVGCLDDTPAGPVYVSATPSGVAGIAFGYPSTYWGLGMRGQSPALEQALAELEEYFSGWRKIFSMPLDLSALKPFQRRVLALTTAIPFGQVRRYGELAAELGNRNAARAVGGALAANPLPIVIPCHRVVGSDGRLHGFASPQGIRTKAILLELEGQQLIAERLV